MERLKTRMFSIKINLIVFFLFRHLGWMQLVILIYHMTGASQVVPLYMQMRVLVSSYLFLTGFGHLSFFWNGGTASFSRLFQVKQSNFFKKTDEIFVVVSTGFISDESDDSGDLFVHESPVSVVLFCPTGLILVPRRLHCPGHSAESQCRHLRCKFRRLSLHHRQIVFVVGCHHRPLHVRGH